MELVCEKFKEKMDADGACCRHPADYCQFRTSCMIHFIGKENERDSSDILDKQPPQSTEKEQG
jgi:hypothetical protein